MKRISDSTSETTTMQTTNSNVTHSNETEYWIPTTPPTDDDDQEREECEWTSEEVRILQREMKTETNYWVRLSLYTLMDEARRLQSELKLRAMSDEEREAYMRDQDQEYQDQEYQDQEYQEHLMNESLEQREENAEMPDCADCADCADGPKTRTETRETRETREPRGTRGTRETRETREPRGTTRDKKPATATATSTSTQQTKQTKQTKQTQLGKKMKFAPIQITINVNHCSSSSYDHQDGISVGKKEINMPTKQRASREAKKRDDEKWTHINREQKHSNARGTH